MSPKLLATRIMPSTTLLAARSVMLIGSDPPGLNWLESSQIRIWVQYLDVFLVEAEHVVLEVPPHNNS
jgi:hypothetical protein